MIIELFGPPGSGKTTFAQSLAILLRERGHITNLFLSYRPSERAPSLTRGRVTKRSHPNAVLLRLSRPVIEMLTIARHPFANSKDLSTAINLLNLLSPRHFLSTIKEGQYLLRLSHSWSENTNTPSIALFDQGFIQAICSLALLAGVTGDTPIASALDCAPRADLLIRLDAPWKLLEGRLENRRRLQSTIERRFDRTVEASLSSISLFDRLHTLLLNQGRTVLRASSIDQRSLDESVQMIGQLVSAKANLGSRSAHD